MNDETQVATPTETPSETAPAAEPQTTQPVETQSAAEPAQGLTGEADAGSEKTDDAPAEGLGSGADAEEKTPPGAIGAPEGDYSTEGIEMPEGVKLDEGAMTELGKVCRDLNLSQKAFTDIVSKMTPVLQARQQAQLEDIKRHFIEQGRNDSEIGGAKWKATMASAEKAYAKFTDAETRKVLQVTGLNCHPGIIRMFNRINELISDDAVVRGQPSSKRDPLANFYDHSDMN